MGLPAKPPKPGPADPFSYPLPQLVDLGAGLQGLLLEDHRLPLVHLQVMMRAGAAAETAAGAAYACASMVDEGAGRRSAIQLAAEVQQLGAVLAIWTGCDSSNLTLQVLRVNLDRALDLCADVLLRPRFEAAEWKRVRAEMHGRALQRRARPAEVSGLGLSRLVFGEHPYGRPLLPTPGAVTRLTLGSVRGFHRDHYRRDHAVVVAAGDLNAVELARKVGRRLEGWASGSAPRWRPKAPPRLPRGRRLGLIDRPEAPQSALQVGHVAPPRRRVDWAGVKLLNTILGGAFTSRLNLNLRERHGFTYGVRSWFALLREAGMASISTSVATDDTVAALREIIREVEALREAPVSRAELRKAQQLVVESLPAQAETLEDLTEEYAGLCVHELPWDSLTRLPEKVAAHDTASLHGLARELLHPDRLAIVVVGDARRLRRELSGLADRVVLLDEDGLPTRG